MGMKVENYNMGDLEKYAKFRQANPDLKVLEAIRLYNLMRQEDGKVFVENFYKLLEETNRQTKTWNFGNHFSIYYYRPSFAFHIGYSHDTSEQDANIVSIIIGFLTFEIRF